MNLQPIDLMSDPADVRADVREHYAARVRTESSCCGPSCCTGESANASQLYTSEELALVPAESATIAYGCGNPGAIAALQPGEVVLDMGSGGGIDCFLAARAVLEFTGKIIDVEDPEDNERVEISPHSKDPRVRRSFAANFLNVSPVLIKAGPVRCPGKTMPTVPGD